MRVSYLDFFQEALILTQKIVLKFQFGLWTDFLHTLFPGLYQAYEIYYY